MYLIECLADSHTAFLQLHLHQGQSVDQYGHIIAVGLRACLLKLVDDLHFIAGNIFFVQQINILDMPVIKNKVIDIIVVNFAGFFNDAVTGLIQPFRHKARPFLL